MGRHTSTQKLHNALTFGGSQVQLMKVARILLPRVLSDQMSVTQETSKDIASWVLPLKILERYLCQQQGQY